MFQNNRITNISSVLVNHIITNPLITKATNQTIITRPSEALRRSSWVCPIKVDRPGTRETVPEAVARL